MSAEIGDRCSVVGCMVAGPYRVGAFFTLCPTHVAAFAAGRHGKIMRQAARLFLMDEAAKLKRGNTGSGTK